MRRRARRRAWYVAACGLLAIAGCSSSSSPRPSGTVHVFAAASLTGAFTAARADLASTHPGLNVATTFAGSNALAAQILQGAPADVFASADEANMAKLRNAGVVGTPVTFARNQLEIVVAPGNPKHINGVTDLGRADVTVVLGAVGVPAGDYTREVLHIAHVSVHPRSLETDVKAAVAKVTAGEADATVAYVTDVRAAGSAVIGVTIPGDVQPLITYPIAVVKATKNRAAAQAFVDSAVSGDVQRALEAAGFLPPR